MNKLTNTKIINLNLKGNSKTVFLQI